MPKILFLTVHRPNRSPSQRFRFEQYIPFLEENGFQCTQFFLLDEKSDKIFYSPGNIPGKLMLVIKSISALRKCLRKADEYDFIFVQRECFMLGSSYFEKQFSKKKGKFIYDFDDSIWLLDVSDANKKFAWLKDPDKTSKIISYSNLVVAGNAYLADYALQFNKNVRIIPTTVDTKQYQWKRKNTGNPVCIGWSGSLTTMKHFDRAVPFLIKLKEKYGNAIRIKVIGDGNYINEKLNIKGVAWKSESEVEELSEFDIGIMPLPDDKWANGKCGLKGLQYMALEIPTVMSPVGVNKQIISEDINGYLASDEQEWINKISMLVDSADLREKIGKAGRATVEQRFSVESQKKNYLELFKK